MALWGDLSLSKSTVVLIASSLDAAAALTCLLVLFALWRAQVETLTPVGIRTLNSSLMKCTMSSADTPLFSLCLCPVPVPVSCLSAEQSPAGGGHRCTLYY